ncbi:MAG: hypothetical protein Q7R83_03840 [bacterium]|nr:hypothetical protein [bacterium]
MYATGNRERPEELKQARTRAVFRLLGLVAILGWLYVIFISDLFCIKDIRASGLKTLDPMEVKREVLATLDERGYWRPWPARHGWFIDRERLAETMNERFFADNVAVDKSYGHILRLMVEERSNRIIFHSHQQYLWVDLHGAAINELDEDSKKTVQAILLGQRQMTANDTPIIHQDLDEQVASGYSVATTEHLRSWITIASALTKNGLWFRELEPHASSTASLRVITSDGLPLIMDPSADLLPQIQAYQAFKKSKPKDINAAEYIDVRIPGRIYVK